MSASRFPAAAVALVLLTVAAPVAGDFHEALGTVADKHFVLVMEGHRFNGRTYPDTPLLEAALGERLHFTVMVPQWAEAHTFHLHGHPWFVESVNRVVDTWLLEPGDVHSFVVTAGGVDKHAGDWMYHCHVTTHMEGGMWGVLRVYPFATTITGSVPAFTVQLDRLGEPVDGADLVVEVEGREVAAHVTPLGSGAYRVDTALPERLADAPLVVTATHPELGTSVARVHADAAPTLADVDGAHDGHAH